MNDSDLQRLRDHAPTLATTGLAETTAALEAIDLRSLDLESKLAALDGATGATEPWREEEIFSVPGAHASLFLVPRGGVLPLHDHPEMTVLLRAVAGRLSIRSYDWAADHPGCARRTAERVVAAGDPVQALLPGQGNLHRIEALEPSAFLDVFSPYYSDEEGRPCTYYREEGTVEIGGETLFRLVACPEEEAESRASVSA